MQSHPSQQPQRPVAPVTWLSCSLLFLPFVLVCFSVFLPPFLLFFLPLRFAVIVRFLFKNQATWCKRHGFNPWVRNISIFPQRRKWQPTPVFLPAKSQGQRSLVGYSPWGCKQSDMAECTHVVPCTCSKTNLSPVTRRDPSLRPTPKKTWSSRSSNKHGWNKTTARGSLNSPNTAHCENPVPSSPEVKC